MNDPTERGCNPPPTLEQLMAYSPNAAALARNDCYLCPGTPKRKGTHIVHHAGGNVLPACTPCVEWLRQAIADGDADPVEQILERP